MVTRREKPLSLKEKQRKLYTANTEVFTRSDDTERSSVWGCLATGHRSIILTSGEGVCTYVVHGANLDISPRLPFSEEEIREERRAMEKE